MLDLELVGDSLWNDLQLGRLALALLSDPSHPPPQLHSLTLDQKTVVTQLYRQFHLMLNLNRERLIRTFKINKLDD